MKNESTTRHSLIAGAAVLGAFMASAALTTPTAEAAPYGVNARQHRQDHRIHDGVKSGELTRHERRQLNARERHTNRMENRFRRSGDRFTFRERTRIQHQLNRNSRAIYRQKHDRQDRD